MVVDVFVYSLALLLEFAALIALRRKRPDMHRPFKIPGGWPVIVLITVLPTLIVMFATWQNVQDSGISSMYLSVGAALLGPISYPFAKRFIKRDKPTEPVVVDDIVIWSDT